VNLAPKLVTKILDDRLQIDIIGFIHKNQYKSRTIQDFLAWCFEYIHLSHQSRREAIFLKLDFEKAFDFVKHQVIIQIMTYLGLPSTWTNWISNILNSDINNSSSKWGTLKILQMQNKCSTG
jgi:hypothetical protein